MIEMLKKTIRHLIVTMKVPKKRTKPPSYKMAGRFVKPKYAPLLKILNIEYVQTCGGYVELDDDAIRMNPGRPNLDFTD